MVDLGQKGECKFAFFYALFLNTIIWIMNLKKNVVNF